MDYLLSVGTSGFLVKADLPKCHARRLRQPGKRGKCQGMSAASRRSLIRWLLTREVPGAPSWAVTLTVPECEGADVWREKFNHFRVLCVQHSLPFVWRVELQRRGVPHLHCILYADEIGVERFRHDWLSVWGLLDHPAALRRAVDYRAIESDAWFSYVVFHQFKHSVNQSGWQGRHWGVVGRRFFSDRFLSEFRLSSSEYDRARAILYWFVRREFRSRRVVSGSGPGSMRHVPRFSGWSHVVSDWTFLVRRIVEHVRKG